MTVIAEQAESGENDLMVLENVESMLFQLMTHPKLFYPTSVENIIQQFSKYCFSHGR